MIRFTTYTGSSYLWDDVGSRLKREGVGADSGVLQRDGEWIGLFGDVFLEVGQSAVFAMDVPSNRFRVTSEVLAIEEM